MKDQKDHAFFTPAILAPHFSVLHYEHPVMFRVHRRHRQSAMDGGWTTKPSITSPFMSPKYKNLALPLNDNS